MWPCRSTFGLVGCWPEQLKPLQYHWGVLVDTNTELLEEPHMRPTPPRQCPIALPLIPRERLVHVAEPSGLDLRRPDHTDRLAVTVEDDA